ncbi:unnamed protein product [Ectocarpus fasciculatus]
MCVFNENVGTHTITQKCVGRRRLALHHEIPQRPLAALPPDVGERKALLLFAPNLEGSDDGGAECDGGDDTLDDLWFLSDNSEMKEKRRLQTKQHHGDDQEQDLSRIRLRKMARTARTAAVG